MTSFQGQGTMRPKKAKARAAPHRPPPKSSGQGCGQEEPQEPKVKRNQNRGAAIAVIGTNLSSSLSSTRNWLCDFGQGT